MTEAQNFVEKELEKNSDTWPESLSQPENLIPTYTPPPTPPTTPIVTPTSGEPTIQVIEKIVYKRQRFHGFFRTLTLLALLAVGFLMLGESTGIIQLSINGFKIHEVFPLFIIISTIIIRSYRGVLGKIFGLILFLGIFGWVFSIGIYTSLNPTSERKTGNEITYTLPSTLGSGNTTNFLLNTLISRSYIKGANISTFQGKRNSDRTLHITSWIQDNTYTLNRIEDNNRNILQNYFSKIQVTLPSKQTLDTLYIKSFFWLHTIDLNNITRNTFKFHAGIDDIVVHVGNVSSGNKIEIQGAVAETDIFIPKNIGIIMEYKDRMGTLTIPDFDILSGNYYQSKNITTADAIIHVYINLGIANTTIHRTPAINIK